MNDSLGNELSRGDTVTLTGRVLDVTEDPNFLNCTVQLAKPMPPTGAQIKINLNTAMLTREGEGKPPYIPPLPAYVERIEGIRSAESATITRILMAQGQMRQELDNLEQFHKGLPERQVEHGSEQMNAMEKMMKELTDKVDKLMKAQSPSGPPPHEAPPKPPQPHQTPPTPPPHQPPPTPPKK